MTENAAAKQVIILSKADSMSKSRELYKKFGEDFRKYADLEKYLFAEVGRRFRKNGMLTPTDFFLILIWKANRAKTKHRDRLIKIGGSFERSVRSISSELRKETEPREQLFILMNTWQFRLPTASAILTVLHPGKFSVYDYRVCDQLGGFHNLEHISSKTIWPHYVKFLAKVRAACPTSFSLRDCDHHLWGKSLCEDVQRDLKAK